MGKDVEGQGHDTMWGTNPALALTEENHDKAW
jgi:hypothetical protein